MHAAASRSPGPVRSRRAHNPGAKPHPAIADDSGWLDARPIAAAIIELGDEGCLKLTSHNSRFYETVHQSTCTALDWNEADCVKSGPIAELLQRFFDGTDVSGELD